MKARGGIAGIARIAVVVWWGAAACAGDLKDPERFAFLLGDGGVFGPADASGIGPGTSDAGTPDAGGPAPVAVPVCVSNVFSMHCGTAACHGDGATQVDLVSPGVAARLVGQQAGAAGMCAGRVFVSADGSESLLLDKLSDAPPCGSKMPLVGAALADAELKCVMDWVASLAGGT